MGSGLKLGINLSHDSSTAVCDDLGNIVYALQEERISRQKNSCAFPEYSISEVMSQIQPSAINEVVVGGTLYSPRYVYWLFENQKYPSFNYLHGNQFPPHFEAKFQEFIRNNSFDSTRGMLDFFLQKKLIEFGINPKITYRNHHDSHVASALVGSSLRNGLAVSLDGHGDRESGRIKSFDLVSGKGVSDLAEIPATQSLGDLYSAVTRRYNFKTSQHEGKITGLAAYGQSSPALEFLFKYVSVQDGIPQIKLNRNEVLKVASRLARRRTGKHVWHSTFDELIETASSLTFEYADLAFAIQKILEDSVVDILDYWTKKTGQKNVALAGGVFANVKVNQKIAELENVEKVFIFPNMGDSGLAVGAIWDLMLSRKQTFSIENKFHNMYLDIAPATEIEIESICKMNNLRLLDISKNWEDFVSEKIAEKKIIGVIQGKMEFGPRALLNRSIIADPSIPNINAFLNKKLRRTEFMPFAPACLVEDLEEIFEIEGHGSLVPFEYMTMTCKVKKVFQPIMPAVVHIDGTARPQSVSFDQNPRMWNVIKKFKEKTGIPTIINTSFNAHEEPIVRTIGDGIGSVVDGSIDYLVTENYAISKSQ